MSEDSPSNREKITDRDLLDVFQTSDSPVLSTSEISEIDEIPISQGQVLKRLKSLEEKDRVSSKTYSAKPQIRLWWHQRVDMKKAWPSDDVTTDKIGVEVIDALELPGRNETLRKRREAVNAVFKFLFEIESASKEDLYLVGWGADMDTYANPHSLWNNCLKKALDQSPFYILDKSEKEWQLSKLGSELKRIGEQGLWDNWEENKEKLDEKYHSVVWTLLYGKGISFQIRHQNHTSSVAREFAQGDPVIVHGLNMDGPVWSCSTGTFEMVLELRDNPENLETILDNRDHLTSNIETDARWENHIKDRSALQVRCSQPIDIDASRMFQQQGKEYNDVIYQLRKLIDWESGVREQLSAIVKDASQLVE